ncbi:hypothetical protein [Bradyrhizobium sp. 5.13L]
MTVASEENRSGPYTGNGVTTVFDYEFRILDETHISVIRTEADVGTVLALGADYAVSGVGDGGGGSITTTVAPTAAQSITMLRNVPFTQEVDLENQGPFFAQTIEDALDLGAMRDQQLAELVSRALLVPASGAGDYDGEQLVNDVLAVKSERLLAEAARDAASDSAAAAAAVLVDKADKASPALTGVPTAPTAAAGTNTDQIATTAFVLANSASGIYKTRTALAAAIVSAADAAVLCLGYSVQGDCDAFVMKRVATKPLRGGVRSADRYLPNGTVDATNGGWWIYVPSAAGTDARAFGCKADWNGDDGTATNNTPFLQEAIDFTALNFGLGYDSGGGNGGDVLLPRGTMMFNDYITVETGVRIIGHGTFGTVMRLANAYPNYRNFISLGSTFDQTSVCQPQTTSGAGNLVINGYLAVGGRVDYLWKQELVMYSAGNLSGITFTITGVGRDGQPQTDTMAGPTAGAFAFSNKHWLSITQVSASAAVTSAVSVGSRTIASMASTVENVQLFSDHLVGTSNTAMVWSNNTQHTGGLKKVKIFCGFRHGVRLETGIGGASYFTLEDVECFSPLQVNSAIYLNYAGLLTTVRNIVISGLNPGSQPNQVGIELIGGYLEIDTYHPENIATGLLIKLPNANAGAVHARQILGLSNMTNVISIDVNTPANISMFSAIYSGGAAYTIRDYRAGGANTTGNIIGWKLT